MVQYQLILVLFLPTPNLWIGLADGFLLIVKEVEPEMGVLYSLELSNSEYPPKFGTSQQQMQLLKDWLESYSRTLLPF